MKKFLFFAAIVACSLICVSCETEYSPEDDDPIEQKNPNLEELKAAVKGSWYGEIQPLYGEGGTFATVTFTDNTFTVYQDEQTLRFDILYWDTNDIVVWVVLDEGKGDRNYNMFVALKENGMLHLSSNDPYIIDNVPWDLVRVE